MKVPKPRLRQVFEHTTHFKVFKPGAQKPIVIAKAGLTPGLHGRLRGFARGGVPTQEEANAEARAFDAVMPAEEPITTQPELLAAPKPVIAPADAPAVTYNDVVKAYTDEFNQENPDEEQLTYLADTMKAMEPASIRATPVPAPVAAPASVPVAVAPAVEPERPAVPVGPIAQTFAPTPVAVAPAVAATEAPVAALSSAPAPVVASVPAVTPPAAPLAVAAPAGFVMPPKVGEMAPADALSATLKANPGKTKEEAASALADLAVPKPAEKTDFDAMLAAVEPRAGATAVDQFDAATQARRKSAIEKARSDYDTQTQIADINRKAIAQQILASGKDEEVKAKLEQRKASLEDYVNKGFTPKSFFGKEGTGTFFEQLGSIVALAVGGYTSGYAGTPNYVYTSFNKAMDRSLELQKQNRNSVLKQYERVLGDYDLAKKLTEADIKNMAALQIKQIELTSAQRNIGPVTQDLIAKLDASAAENREEVRKKMYDADKARIDAETEKAYRNAVVTQKERVPIAGSRGVGAATPSAMFRQARWESGRTFSVPDPADPAKTISIKAPSEAVARAKIDTITSRIEGTMALEDFEKWLEEHKNEKFNPTTIQEMRLKIANVVEKYPSTMSNSKALVTVAQKDIITPAITSTQLPIIRYLDALGLTSTAIKDLKRDAIRGVKLSVQGAAAPNDSGATEFVRKWSEQGYGGRVGIPTTPRAPAAPQPTPVPAGFTRMRKPDDTLTDVPTANVARAKLAPYEYVEVL